MLSAQLSMDAASEPRSNSIGTGLDHGTSVRGGRNMSRDHVSDLVINQIRQRWNDMTIPALLNELELYKLDASGAKEDLIKTLDNWFHPTYDFDLADLEKSRLKILCVAEKPQLAKELARVLASTTSPIQGNVGGVTYWSFSGSYNGLPADFVFTSTFGHIYTLDFMKQGDAVEGRTRNLKTRSRPDDESLFDEQLDNRNSSEGGDEVFTALRYLAVGRDVLELWLDCDLEGEAICYEVIDIVKDVMNQPPTGNIMDVVFRAKFSAAGDAPKAARSMIKPNFRQNLANIAKHEIDLRVGVSFSNMQTTTLRRAVPYKCIKSVTFGPCQSTCLAYAAKNELLRTDYVQVMLHYVVLKLQIGEKKVEIKLEKSEEEAERIKTLLKGQKECIVKSVEIVNKKKKSPAGLNTFGLLVESSQHLCIGSPDAMKNTEVLYRRGTISYPRSETTRYQDCIDIMKRVMIIKHDFPKLRIDMEKFEARLRDKGFEVNPGIDVGDHTPIIPMEESEKFDPESRLGKVYNLICRHFLASFCDDHLYHTKTVVFDLGSGLTCSHEINVVDDLGYTEYLPEERVEDESSEDLAVNEGTIVRINSITVEHELSKPPKPLRECDLIMFMVDNRIGTDGSIPNHIENLQKRGYLTMNEENREVTVTDLGLQLYKVHKHCIPQLIKPGLRSAFERQLLLIASGEKDYEEVCKPILAKYREAYRSFCKSFQLLCDPFVSCFDSSPSRGSGRGRAGRLYDDGGRGGRGRADSPPSRRGSYSGRSRGSGFYDDDGRGRVDSPPSRGSYSGRSRGGGFYADGGLERADSSPSRGSYSGRGGCGCVCCYSGRGSYSGWSRGSGFYDDVGRGGRGRADSPPSRRGSYSGRSRGSGFYDDDGRGRVDSPLSRGSFSGRGRGGFGYIDSPPNRGFYSGRGGSYPDHQGVDGTSRNGQDNSSGDAYRPTSNVTRRGRGGFNSVDSPPRRGSYSGRGSGFRGGRSIFVRPDSPRNRESYSVRGRGGGRHFEGNFAHEPQCFVDGNSCECEDRFDARDDW